MENFQKIDKTKKRDPNKPNVLAVALKSVSNSIASLFKLKILAWLIMIASFYTLVLIHAQTDGAGVFEYFYEDDMWVKNLSVVESLTMFAKSYGVLLLVMLIPGAIVYLMHESFTGLHVILWYTIISIGIGVFLFTIRLFFVDFARAFQDSFFCLQQILITVFAIFGCIGFVGGGACHD